MLFDPDSADEGPLRDPVRIRLLLAYDGSGFHGFAAQPGQKTVSGDLANAIGNVTRHGVELVCAGRTDSGVHARGQVVHADIEASVDLDALMRSINRQLAPAIVVRSLALAPEGFDARRSALARSYRFLVAESAVPDPLLSRFVWNVGEALDIRSMRMASDALLGSHNFGAFCRRPPGTEAGEPIIRKGLDVRWTRVALFSEVVGRGAGRGDVGDEESLLRFDIRATSFCHQMVRSLVGTIVEVGRGRMKPSDIPRLLESGDRSGAKTLAPPHGLSLMRVDYPDWVTE